MAAAVNCLVAPTFTVSWDGETTTELTGMVTITAIVAVWPSTEARTVVEPFATPVITPLVTVATEGSVLLHEIVRPTRGLPAASSGVAVTVSVVPTATDT